MGRSAGETTGPVGRSLVLALGSSSELEASPGQALQNELVNATATSAIAESALSVIDRTSEEDLLTQLGLLVRDMAYGTGANWRTLSSRADIDWSRIDDAVTVMRNCESAGWWWTQTPHDEQRLVSPVRNGDKDRYAADSARDVWWSEPILAGLARTCGVTPTRGVPVHSLCRDDHNDDGTYAASRSAGSTGALVIGDKNGWLDLVAQYPRVIASTDRPEWSRWFGWPGDWVQPDWARVALDWACITVTIGACVDFSYSASVVGEHRSVLAGWNPGETVWFQAGA